MGTRATEILDIAQLVFADEEFEAIGSEDMADINGTDDDFVMLSGSTRAVSAYDPHARCNVDAIEVFGIGKDAPEAGPTDAHAIILMWEDEAETTCSVNLDSGACFEHGSDTDVSTDPQWRQRILGALCVLADKQIET